MHWGESPHEITLDQMRSFPLGYLASWVPGLLTTLAIIGYGAIKFGDHQGPATRVIASGCLSLFGNLVAIAAYWLFFNGSVRRIQWFSIASFGSQMIHIAATILLLSAVFMERVPRGRQNEAMQSFPPQMR